MLKDYQGVPYHDGNRKGGAQQIPGRVMCAYYDLGGEGIAYHDTTQENHGSGTLNPPNGCYENEFRMHESVDVSYTKPQWDDTVLNMVKPELGMFYIGWTEPGEWTRYTVQVTHTAQYDVSFFYASARENASVSLRVDEQEPIVLTALPTGHPHIWNTMPFARLHLEQGAHVLTLATVNIGQMNYGYLDFSIAEK